MDCLQGHLLLASPRLVDSNFARSVVLIVRHGEEGAMGLILNRPLEVTVRQACEQAFETACEMEEPLYLGGPCEGPLMVLHTDPVLSDIDVIPGVFVAVEKMKVESLMAGDGMPSRFFVGHAGWTAGQLESEMESGSWLTAAAEQEHIFDGGPKQWIKLMRRVTLGKWVDPDRIPEDPSVN